MKSLQFALSQKDPSTMMWLVPIAAALVARLMDNSMRRPPLVSMLAHLVHMVA